MKMHRHTADILDFMKPYRDRLLKQSHQRMAEYRAADQELARLVEERTRHIDPKHDAMLTLVQEEDAPPGP